LVGRACRFEAVEGIEGPNETVAGGRGRTNCQLEGKSRE